MNEIPEPVATPCGPAVILVEPQLGENIGAVARAMLNCGLADLRLVKPRAGWSTDAALATAKAAGELVRNAPIFESTSEAVADLGLIYAATRRARDLRKPVHVVDRACQELSAALEAGSPGGVLFGPERTGLSNEDIALSNRILHIPLDPQFASLNLAQAVLLVAWEHHKLTGPAGHSPKARKSRERAARAEELLGFYEHLEQELDEAGFFRVPERREIVMRDLRSLFQRANLKAGEIGMLHGLITALSGHRKDGKAARRIGSKRREG